MYSRDACNGLSIEKQIVLLNEQFVDLDKSIGAALKLLKPLKGGDKEEAQNAIIEMTAKRGKLYADISEEDGLLPGYQYLCVDEAHLLESNFSNALSEYVSMRTLLRNVRNFKTLGGNISSKQLEHLADAVDLMQARSEVLDDNTIMLTHRTSVAHSIRAQLSIIADVLFDLPTPSKSKDNDLLAAHIALKRMAATIRTASSEAVKGQAYLRFSPVRAFPQLFLGRSSVQSVLQRMWEGVEAGVAASATLYLRKGAGFSASYQRILLAIPDYRAKEYKPVFPDFLLTAVQGIWIPVKASSGEATNRIWLRPPTRADALSAAAKAAAEQEWISELAPVVHHIVDTAAGGTLILMTSYASASALAAVIGPSPYLVVAQSDLPLASQSERFLKLAHAGHKPVWIATGGAWTGLDIGGHDPYARLFGEQIAANLDNILTDLIIPRIPFGTNQSITHAFRLKNNPGIPWEMLHATFLTKQGIGRLIRRDGLPANRRIWLLDGRLNDPGMSNYIQGIRNVVSCYRQFDLVLPASK
jgi:CRISPR type IV-associated DEAD/DEAH-box helicase Csf4